MSRSYSPAFKFTALFLSICLILSESVSYAAPAAPPPEIPRSFSTISIPATLGRIEESRIVSRSTQNAAPTVIYIQDAHDSLEAQENIAKIIHYLVARHGVKTVFEEGYEGPVPTDKFFGFIKDPKIRQKVSYFLLDKLRLGGAEYAHINRKEDFQLIGADDRALHLENIRHFGAAAKHQKEVARDLAALEAEIEKLIQRHFPRELKEWIKLKERLDHGEIGLLDYWKRMVGRDKSRPYGPADFFKILNRLENNFANRFLLNERDRRTFRYYKTLTLLKRLNQIEVTAAEYEALGGAILPLRTESLVQFIAKEGKKSLVLSKHWEKLIQSALRFYETALARDKAIERALDEYVGAQFIAPFKGRDKSRPYESDSALAVLVFGGFHKGRIKEILRQKGLSYIVVSPRITEVEPRHQAYYKRLMSVGHHPFEAPFQAVHAARSEPLLARSEARAEIRAVYEAVSFLSKNRPVSFTPDDIERYLQSPRSEVRQTELGETGSPRPAAAKTRGLAKNARPTSGLDQPVKSEAWMDRKEASEVAAEFESGRGSQSEHRRRSEVRNRGSYKWTPLQRVWRERSHRATMQALGKQKISEPDWWEKVLPYLIEAIKKKQQRGQNRVPILELGGGWLHSARSVKQRLPSEDFPLYVVDVAEIPGQILEEAKAGGIQVISVPVESITDADMLGEPVRFVYGARILEYLEWGPFFKNLEKISTPDAEFLFILHHPRSKLRRRFADAISHFTKSEMLEFHDDLVMFRPLSYESEKLFDSEGDVRRFFETKGFTVLYLKTEAAGSDPDFYLVHLKRADPSGESLVEGPPRAEARGVLIKAQETKEITPDHFPPFSIELGVTSKKNRRGRVVFKGNFLFHVPYQVLVADLSRWTRRKEEFIKKRQAIGPENWMGAVPVNAQQGAVLVLHDMETGREFRVKVLHVDHGNQRVLIDYGPPSAFQIAGTSQGGRRAETRSKKKSDATLKEILEREIRNNFVRPFNISIEDWRRTALDYETEMIGEPIPLKKENSAEFMFQRGWEAAEEFRWHRLEDDETVLDIGSGPKGGYAFVLALLGYHVTSFEKDPKAVRALKKKYGALESFIREAGGSWRWLQGDFSDPKVRSQLKTKFQHIIATDVILPLAPKRFRIPLMRQSRPTTDKNKILSIIEGIADAKSPEVGMVLVSLPTGSLRRAQPYEREILEKLRKATGLKLLSMRRISVPFSLGIKSGLLMVWIEPLRRAEARSILDWEELDQSNLFEEGEIEEMERRMPYLEGGWSLWDDHAKEMLLEPSFLLMLLGIKPGYVRSTPHEGLPMKFFGAVTEHFNEAMLLAIPNLGRETPLAISIPQAAQVIGRNKDLLKSYGFELDEKFVTAFLKFAEDPLKYDPQYIVEYIFNLFQDAVRDENKWDVFMGLISGYPAEDVNEFVKLNGRHLWHEGVLKNHMDYIDTEFRNVFFWTRKGGSSQAAHQRARYRAALYYAYSKFRRLEGFNEIAVRIGLPETVYQARAPRSLERSEARTEAAGAGSKRGYKKPYRHRKEFVQALEKVLEGPSVTRQELAKKMGYENPNTFMAQAKRFGIAREYLESRGVSFFKGPPGLSEKNKRQRFEKKLRAKLALADQEVGRGQPREFWNRVAYLMGHQYLHNFIYKARNVYGIDLEALGPELPKPAPPPFRLTEQRRWLAEAVGTEDKQKWIETTLHLADLGVIGTTGAYTLIQAVRTGEAGFNDLDRGVAKDLGLEPVSVQNVLIGAPRSDTASRPHNVTQYLVHAFNTKLDFERSGERPGRSQRDNVAPIFSRYHFPFLLESLISSEETGREAQEFFLKVLDGMKLSDQPERILRRIMQTGAGKYSEVGARFKPRQNADWVKIELYGDRQSPSARGLYHRLQEAIENDAKLVSRFQALLQALDLDPRYVSYDFFQWLERVRHLSAEEVRALSKLLVYDAERLPGLAKGTEKTYTLKERKGIVERHFLGETHKQIAKDLGEDPQKIRHWTAGRTPSVGRRVGAAEKLRDALKETHVIQQIRGRMRTFEKVAGHFLKETTPDTEVFHYLDQIEQRRTPTAAFLKLGRALAFSLHHGMELAFELALSRIADDPSLHLDSAEIVKVFVNETAKHMKDPVYLENLVGVLLETAGWQRERYSLERVLHFFHQWIGAFPEPDELIHRFGQVVRVRSRNRFIHRLYDRVIERLFAPLHVLPSGGPTRHRRRSFRYVTQDDKFNLKKIHREIEDHTRRLARQHEIMADFLGDGLEPGIFPVAKMQIHLIKRYPFMIRAIPGKGGRETVINPAGMEFEDLTDVAKDALREAAYDFDEPAYFEIPLEPLEDETDRERLLEKLKERYGQIEHDLSLKERGVGEGESQQRWRDELWRLENEKEFLDFALRAHRASHWALTGRKPALKDWAERQFREAKEFKLTYRRKTVIAMSAQYLRFRMSRAFLRHREEREERKVTVVSLEDRLGGEGGMERKETLVDKKEEAAISLLKSVDPQTKEKLNQAMGKTLHPRDRLIVELRYGLDSLYEGMELTFEDIAQIITFRRLKGPHGKVDVSQQNIQQVLQKSLDKIANAFLEVTQEKAREDWDRFLTHLGIRAMEEPAPLHAKVNAKGEIEIGRFLRLGGLKGHVGKTLTASLVDYYRSEVSHKERKLLPFDAVSGLVFPYELIINIREDSRLVAVYQVQVLRKSAEKVWQRKDFPVDLKIYEANDPRSEARRGGMAPSLPMEGTVKGILISPDADGVRAPPRGPGLRRQAQSEARMVQADLARFGVKITDQGIDFSAVPKNAEWVMDQIRPIEERAVALSLDEMSVTKLLHPLDSLPQIAEASNNSDGVFLGIARVGNAEQPVVIKRFLSPLDDQKNLRELIFAQVYDRLGIYPRFYGVVKTQNGRVSAYVMQVSIGSPMDGISLMAYEDLWGSQDRRNISDRLEDVGLHFPKDYILTRAGRLIAIDAGDAKLAPHGDAQDLYDAFIHRLNKSDSASNNQTQVIRSEARMVSGREIREKFTAFLSGMLENYPGALKIFVYFDRVIGGRPTSGLIDSVSVPNLPRERANRLAILRWPAASILAALTGHRNWDENAYYEILHHPEPGQGHEIILTLKKIPGEIAEVPIREFLRSLLALQLRLLQGDEIDSIKPGVWDALIKRGKITLSAIPYYQDLIEEMSQDQKVPILPLLIIIQTIVLQNERQSKNFPDADLLQKALSASQILLEIARKHNDRESIQSAQGAVDGFKKQLAATARAEARRRPQKDLRDWKRPVGVFIDARELAGLAAREADERWDEILALVAGHPAFDLYIDGADRYPVFNLAVPKLRKLLEEYPERVHVGMLDRANLAKKQIIVQASFREGEGTAADTLKIVHRLKAQYQIKTEILPLEYARPGALTAFLSLAEFLTPVALLQRAGEAYAARARNGRWRVAESYLAGVWNKMQSDFVIRWSA